MGLFWSYLAMPIRDSHDVHTHADVLVTDHAAYDADGESSTSAEPACDHVSTPATVHRLYSSSDEEHEEDVQSHGQYRTVLVSFEASHHKGTVFDIVDQLHLSGTIVSIAPSVLIPLHERCHVLITYLHEISAVTCIESHHLSSIDSHHTHATPFQIEPYPLSAAPLDTELCKLVEYGTISRMLIISNISADASPNDIASLFAIDGSRWNDILGIETFDPSFPGEPYKIVKIHFNSVKNAIRAYRKAISSRHFKNCGVEFFPDIDNPGQAALETNDMPVIREVPEWIKRDPYAAEYPRHPRPFPPPRGSRAMRTVRTAPKQDTSYIEDKRPAIGGWHAVQAIRQMQPPEDTWFDCTESSAVGGADNDDGLMQKPGAGHDHLLTGCDGLTPQDSAGRTIKEAEHSLPVLIEGLEDPGSKATCSEIERSTSVQGVVNIMDM